MIKTDLVRRRIRAEREKKSLSVIDIAAKLGMDERNYKRIESGEKKHLDVEMLDAIAKALEIEFSDLFATESVTINNTHDNDIHDNEVGNAFSNNEVHISSLGKEAKEHYELIIAELRNIVAAKEDIIRQQAALLFAKTK